MPYFSSISDTMWMCCNNASRDNQGLLMEDFIDTDKVKEALESQLKETPTVRSTKKVNDI
ncbi:hypothetical protein BGAL_0025g00110 [Botrytis galanthina]|uniref:Uncharacterized protein n=1 Tax=Botrytis galanthina TaxID=278940 RepID=A0A4S8RAX0_9HELO|nr:hypothetical protein BGAL_0025g00110 [Botrytis galanthina]